MRTVQIKIYGWSQGLQTLLFYHEFVWKCCHLIIVHYFLLGENTKNVLQSDLEKYKCVHFGGGSDGEGNWDISSCVEISSNLMTEMRVFALSQLDHLYGQMDKASYRVASPRLKMKGIKWTCSFSLFLGLSW